MEKASNRILALTKELTKAKEDSKHDSEELRRVQLRVEELENSEKHLTERCIVLECDLRSLKK